MSQNVIKTRNGNTYLHDKEKECILLSHPLFACITGLDKQGINLQKLLTESLSPRVNLPGYGEVLKSDCEYYIRKLALFKKAGYFTGEKSGTRYGKRITKQAVLETMANTQKILFETTSRCNLRCEYCIYGKFYQEEDIYKGDLDINVAVKLLGYMEKLWNSPLNRAYGKDIYLSFYGGEPLLNFRFIEEVVNRAKAFQLNHNRCCFSITTNGILLDKYMDYLVGNDFQLHISIDGNRRNNSYRVFADNKESFAKLTANLEKLREKNPRFFRTKVDLCAVLHNRNSLSEVYDFFKSGYDKIPYILEINDYGIKPAEKARYRETYANLHESLEKVEDKAKVEEDMFGRLPLSRGLEEFLHGYNPLFFNDLNQAYPAKAEIQYVPTETCLPFSTKVFVTSDGKLLPCEKIPRKYFLGRVFPDKVELDFDEIASRYNGYYDKMQKQCEKCGISNSCSNCIYFCIDVEESHPVCKFSSGCKELFSTYLSHLEDNPGIYAKVFKKEHP